MKTQKNPIGNDFNANVIQENLFQLFQYAHEHVVKNAFPAASDGAIRDVVVVDTGSAVYLCVKTSRGWFKSAAMTAV
jgi:hypothetical protein